VHNKILFPLLIFVIHFINVSLDQNVVPPFEGVVVVVIVMAIVVDVASVGSSAT